MNQRTKDRWLTIGKLDSAGAALYLLMISEWDRESVKKFLGIRPTCGCAKHYLEGGKAGFTKDKWTSLDYRYEKGNMFHSSWPQYDYLVLLKLVHLGLLVCKFGKTRWKQEQLMFRVK